MKRADELRSMLKGTGDWIELQLTMKRHSPTFINAISDKIILIAKMSYELGTLQEFDNYINMKNELSSKIFALQKEKNDLKRQLKTLRGAKRDRSNRTKRMEN